MVPWGLALLVHCTNMHKVHTCARYLDGSFRVGISDGRGAFEEGHMCLKF